jgi:O-antigen/teichoic acid export membrane protein
LKNRILAKLAGETAIYGITHTLGRLINFLLVPLYIKLFTPDDYGVISTYYAVVGFAIVVLMYGMETAFFNFSREEKPEKVFATAQISLLVTTGVLMLVGLTCQQGIANFLEHPNQTDYVRIFVFILALDALSNLPLAWLRFKKMPIRFGLIRITNILVNIGFNLFFLLLVPWLVKKGYDLTFFDPEFGVGYIFLSNLFASMVMFVMLLPYWKPISEGFDGHLWKRMWKYGRPLVIIGLAGIVNEMIDRILLLKMLPNEVADFEIGVYSAFYKLSMFMTIFVQSFRFAAEPFFFEQSKGEDPKLIYAKVMHYFVIALCLIFLVTLVFLKQIGPLIITREVYFRHPNAMMLTPILLLANLFLGVMYNLNIWYKLNDKMRIGMWISIGGALGTIALNVALIPVIGILGSAIATLVVYFGMAVASYMLGQKHYAVPYNLKMIAFYIILCQALYWLYAFLNRILSDYALVWSALTLIAFIAVVYMIERPTKNRKFAA